MDWLAATLGIIGAVAVWKDIRIAMAAWILSNLIYIYFGIESQMYSMLLRDGGYLVINLATIYIRRRNP